MAWLINGFRSTVLFGSELFRGRFGKHPSNHRPLQHLQGLTTDDVPQILGTINEGLCRKDSTAMIFAAKGFAVRGLVFPGTRLYYGLLSSNCRVRSFSSASTVSAE